MKTIHIILLSVLLAILIFSAFLYVALRTKITDVSAFEPYSSILNQPLVLKKGALLLKNDAAFVLEEPYLLTASDEQVFSEITEVHSLDAGTELVFYTAKHFKNGTSGSTTSVLLGKIKTPEGEKEFEVIWGSQKESLNVEEHNAWSFAEPLWLMPNSKEHDVAKFYRYD